MLDVDGVLVPRGTKIKQEGQVTTLETKKIAEKQIQQIKKLHELGFTINISSGRGLYMLQEMFRTILPYVSITYENGSVTWYKGKLYQHVNSFDELKDIFFELAKVRHENIKGFEPKELIITIHCHDCVKEIEDIAAKYENLYCLWNAEAYDIGIKIAQTKAVGLREFSKLIGLKKENIIGIGDNYNDKELLDECGISVTADKTRVQGDFFVPLNGELLPADLLMTQLIKVCSE